MSEAGESSERSGPLVEGAKEALLESIEEIGMERMEYTRHAQWLKRLNGFFNVLVVLLGVATPAVVTYLTQLPNPDPSLTLKTIILVGVAAAVATLRGLFKWGEKYGFALMTAMKLRELESHARLELEEILHTTNDMMMYGRLSTLNRELQEEWTAIVRRQLVSEGYGSEGRDARARK